MWMKRRMCCLREFRILQHGDALVSSSASTRARGWAMHTWPTVRILNVSSTSFGALVVSSLLLGCWRTWPSTWWSMSDCPQRAMAPAPARLLSFRALIAHECWSMSEPPDQYGWYVHWRDGFYRTCKFAEYNQCQFSPFAMSAQVELGRSPGNLGSGAEKVPACLPWDGHALSLYIYIYIHSITYIQTSIYIGHLSIQTTNTHIINIRMENQHTEVLLLYCILK